MSELRKAVWTIAILLVSIAAIAEEDPQALIERGRRHYEAREFDQARLAYHRALALARENNDRTSEAKALTLLENLHWFRGEYQPLVEVQAELLRVYRETGDRAGEAAALNTSGLVQQQLGQYELARGLQNEALAVARAIGDTEREAIILHDLAWLDFVTGRNLRALETYRQALVLRRVSGDERGAAITRTGIAMTLSSLHDHRGALAELAEALPVLERLGDKRWQADVLDHMGVASRNLGDPAKAIGLHERALAIRIDIGDVTGPAFSRSSMAKAHRDLGNLEAAAEQMEHVITLIESTRAALRSPEMRATFRAGRQGHYEFYIDLLMELERRSPGNGNLSRAFEVSERARARTLLELLAAAGVEADPSPPPMTIADVQRKLLDGSTLLLVYFVGKERSHLWAITPTSLRGYALPKRSEIEPMAQRIHELLSSAPQRKRKRELELVLTKLSGVLLTPIRNRIGNRRLVVVADGALQYVPFGALTDPSRPQRAYTPLIAGHEVVYLPSVSVLGVLRGQQQNRERAAGGIAIVADPVFGRDDERLRATPAQPIVPAALGQSGSRAKQTGDSPTMFRRLRFTRAEADAIAALSDGTSLQLRGLDATRDAIRTVDLSPYRVVHFATHAWVDGEDSAIVLSGVSREGQPIDAKLRTSDIFELKLNADVVVLSACRTALGTEIRGEGIVGLTSAFFRAGGRRVVAALWPVNDRATAALMRNFYEQMLRQNQSPSDALHAAQLTLWRDPRWSSPHYWAAFILQGDWQR